MSKLRNKTQHEERVEKINTDTLVIITNRNYKKFLQDSDIDKLYLRALGGE